MLASFELFFKPPCSIVAVIMFNKNYTGWLETYHILREAYEPIFGTLVFTGLPERPAELPEQERFVTCEAWEGNVQYACFANVMEVRFFLRVFSIIVPLWGSSCLQGRKLTKEKVMLASVKGAAQASCSPAVPQLPWS